MSALITKNINGELEAVLDEFRTEGSVSPRGLSVGGVQPFRGRRRPLSVGAAMPTGGPAASMGYAAGGNGGGGNGNGGGAGVDTFCPSGCSGPEAIKKFLDRIGYPPCRVWGAEPPGGRDALGCPVHKKLCIIPFPVQLSIAAATSGVLLTVKAKLWYWPLMIVDGGSGADITVDDMTFSGDPVLENGALDASAGNPRRSWSPAASYPPEGNYSLMPGLPAFDVSQGLVLSLSNAHATDAQSFAVTFLGVSIRY